MGRIETDWDGKAARDFKARYAVQPDRWKRAARAFDDATAALTAYRSALSDAQYQAERARRLFNAGVAAAEQAATKAGPGFATGTQYQGNFGQSFDPAGAADRARAIDMLEDARDGLRAAGDRAADALVSAQAGAPDPRHWWDAASDFQEQARAWTFVQQMTVAEWAYDNVAVPIVNGLASWGHAAVNNPAALAEMFAGALFMAAGAAGEAGGVVLDASLVGAPVGIPLNIASAGAIAAGGTLIVGGATTITQTAINTDVTILYRMTKKQREADPGYQATPVRSADAGPVTDPDAAPYSVLDARQVSPWGGKGGKTEGLLVHAEGSEPFLSGRNPLVEAIAKPRPGRDGTVITHVESSVGAWMQHHGVKEATLYINRLPCSWGTGGCATSLVKMVPAGSKLTIYGPNNFVRVVYGMGVW